MPRPPLPKGCRTAVDAWNLMGGEIDWSGLPFVLEFLGADDPESVVWQIAEIRDHMQARHLAELERKRR